MSFSSKEVKLAAQGRWREICLALAPQLAPAMEKIGRHVPCPVHGGQDGFRLFKDFDQTGGGICNTCGPRTDGLALISWVNGWTFPATVNAVAAVLGLIKRAANPMQSSSLHAKAAVNDRSTWIFRKYGQIEAIGIAPYQFKEGSQASPYLRLRTEHTERTKNRRSIKASDLRPDQKSLAEDSPKSEVFWGQDLDRALRAADAGRGDWVEIMRFGSSIVRTPNGPKRRYQWAAVKRQPPQSPQEVQSEKFSIEEKDLYRKKKIEEVWAKSRPLWQGEPAAEVAEAYLESRGIVPTEAFENRILAGGALKASPTEPVFSGDGHFLGYFPALLAAVRNAEGQLVTLHKTYLSYEAKKAPIAAPKRFMALPSDRTVSGCAVQLAPFHRVLGIAEGIETALSVMLGLNLPCWAALSAGGLESFEAPKNIEHLIIFEDKDRSGTGSEAADKLYARMEQAGIQAWIVTPPMDLSPDAKSVDWNDVLMAFGVEGFPNPFLQTDGK